MKKSAYRRLDELPKWEKSSFSPIEIPRRILEILKNPQDTFRSIHVGGTNGKGSVCSLLASCLIESGASVGQFASPHLSHVSERCLINGSVAEQAFENALERVVDVAEEHQLIPSYFVATMAASFLAFAEEQVEWGVIEVGLGGRDDATNLLAAPLATIVTSVGLDHMHILGNTIEEIAENKFGIFKPSIPAYLGLASEQVRALALEKTSKEKIPIKMLGVDFDRKGKVLYFKASGLNLALEDELLEDFQLDNRTLASKVALDLGVSPEKVSRGLVNAFWPGRTEELELPSGTPLLLDGAHNEDSAEALSAFLKRRCFASKASTGKLRFLLAVRATKDLEALLGALLGQLRPFLPNVRFLLTGEDLPFAADIADLERTLLAQGISASQIEKEGDSLEAFESFLRDAEPNDYLTITGSLYLVGKLRPQLVDNFLTRKS